MPGSMSAAGRRVVVVTLDACDRDLVLDWARAGELPEFAALLGQSARAFMCAPRAFYVGGVWPSFATATSAATHGFVAFRQLVPGTYREPLCPAESMSGDPFWEHLARAGRRVAVVDVPRIRVSRDLNGIHLADWGNHDPVHPLPVSWPPPLAAEIERRYGRSPVGDCDLVDHSARGLSHLCDALAARIETMRMTYTLGMLLNNGVPLVSALAVVKGTLGNAAMEQAFEHIEKQVREGKTFAGPLGDTELFPTLATHLIRIGEESGRLEEMLFRVADVYEREVHHGIQRLKQVKAADPVLRAALEGVS